MLAANLDNLIFLVLIAVAALFQLLSKAVNKAQKKDSNETSNEPKAPTPRPVQRAPRESDTDRIRKFLEALGQPTSSTPPPPVLPRTDIPPRPVAPVQPPPVIIPGTFRLPRERRPRTDVTQRESSFREIVQPSAPPAAAPAFELHEELSAELEQPSIAEPSIKPLVAPKVFEVTKRKDSKMDIAPLLGSRSSLREAILLREILGTPRGLQALDAL